MNKFSQEILVIQRVMLALTTLNINSITILRIYLYLNAEKEKRQRPATEKRKF